MNKLTALISFALFAMILTSLKPSGPQVTYSLTVKVKDLRNSKGVVQFTLYNKDGTIPDEKFKNYCNQEIGEINNKSSSITFKNLPKGKYAINVHHDENKDKKIDKGWILPIEGIGFSNFKSIGFSNRPNFKKASFYLDEDMTKTVDVIYM